MSEASDLTPAQKGAITRRARAERRKAEYAQQRAEQEAERETKRAAAALMPGPTPAEQAAKEDIVQRMQKLSEILRQNNLNAAVALAQQAARGQGPLVDHFAELGRRFGGRLREPRPAVGRPILRVIDGGISGGPA